MKPQDELKYLKGFIKLSEPQAEKRDALEKFLEDRNKVILLDADSILYKVAHYWMDKESNLEDQYDDFHTQVRAIVNHIEDDGFNVEDVIYFFTTCKKNFRKELDPNYKANRPVNALTHLVSLLKHYTIQVLEDEGNNVEYDDEFEADDLISDEVRISKNIDSMHGVIERDEYIICSIDKDLKQIEGAHFDYYKKATHKESYKCIDWNSETQPKEVKYEYKGWSYTTKQEGYNLLLKQLLIGDTSDNIKGVKGIGQKKADKLLDNKTNFTKLREVCKAYHNEDGSLDRLRTNIKLMKL